MPSLGASLRRLLVIDGAIRLMRPVLLGRRATIFTLHRFSAADGNPSGHDPDVLRASLAFLRRNGYQLLPLSTLVDSIHDGTLLPPRTVIFTVDDGYADFAEVGMPVFAEFDCPVTAFLVTGFLDGALWLWWDQLHYALFATPRRALTLAVNGSILHYEFEDTAGRERTAKRLAEELKCVANDEKKKLIATVASELDVEVPKHCPPRYRPMTWEQVRSCASLGATFGPHTLSHPILSRVSDDEAAHEIAESWSRVQSETTASLPVLAYPNGDTASFGERERRLARSAGLVAAVTTEQEHVAGRRIAAGGPDPYQLPRFSYPDTVEEFAHIAGGLVHAIRTCRLAKPNGRPDPTGHRNLSP